MSKRIVIMPTFAEAHMIMCQIHNIATVLKPDVVIYNEGLFPMGPESTSIINDDFRSKYCAYGLNAGFDVLETSSIIKEAMEAYPHIQWKYAIVDYTPGMKAEDAYSYAVSNFEDWGITVEPGDIIFPSEADVFYHENDIPEIDRLISEMKPGDGISTIWLDFVANQYYVEQKQHPDIAPRAKHRRFAICYKDMDHYHSIVKNFVSQDYTQTTKIVDIYAYHYAMWRPGKYMDLRFAMLNRHPDYWAAYKRGMDEAVQAEIDNVFPDSILVRPTHHGNYRFIKYITINHPAAIKKHECYIHRPEREYLPLAEDLYL